MSSTEEKKTSKNPRARTLRLALYLLVLVGILFWDRERRARLEAEFLAGYTIIPLTQEQLEAIQAARERQNLLFALTDELAAVVRNDGEKEEKLRIADEIIETFQEDKEQYTRIQVCWAMGFRSGYTEDAAERRRLSETMLDKYCDITHKDLTFYLISEMDDLIEHSDSNAGKLAVCENLFTKYESRFVDRLTAHLLDKKAELTRSTEGKIAAYDAMLARFLVSSDDFAFSRTAAAAVSKTMLIDDKTEQIRLCDIVIDAFLKTPGRVHHDYFRSAVGKKAELTGDVSLPLALWNQVIENNVSEQAVVQARAERMALLKDDAERLAACDEFIAAHQAAQDDYVRLMLTRTMLQKARLLADPEEKTDILHSTIEKCAGVTDSRARSVARAAAALLVTLDPDSAAALYCYDELEAMTEEQRKIVLALKEKVARAAGREEKIRLYDDILFNRKDIPCRYFFFRLFRERTDLALDEQEEWRLTERYDTVHEECMEPDVRIHLIFDRIVVTNNAGFTDYALRTCDKIVRLCAEYLDSDENNYGTSPATDAARASVMDNLGKAILAKARLPGWDGTRISDGEILSLCDQYLAYPYPERPAYLNSVREKILAKKAELAGKNLRTPLEQI